MDSQLFAKQQKILDTIAAFPIFLGCPRCDSANVITNSGCCQCGAPLGCAVENRIKKHKYRNSPTIPPLGILQNTFSGSSAYIHPQYAGSSLTFSNPSDKWNPITIDSASGYPNISVSIDAHTGLPTHSNYPISDPQSEIYISCPNCSTLNDISKEKQCQACGVYLGEIL